MNRSLSQQLNRWRSPKSFYQNTQKLVLPCIFFGLGLWLYGLYLGFFEAPADAIQGEVFRILYVHVPAAILALQLYFSMGLMGLVYLIWRIKLFAYALKIFASMGFLLSVITLITGMLWGKPTWGVYWAWDARMTSMLILTLVYLSILLFQRNIRSPLLADKLTAIFSIFGLLMMPLIRFSVEWWYSLHQPATFSLFKASTMHDSMLIPFRWTFVGFALLVLGLMLWYLRLEILRRNLLAQWVQQIIQNTKAKN